MAVINGTAGNDTLAGTSSNDSITGSGGHDSIEGLGGADTLHGGSGDDSLRGGGGSDILRGNGGLDVLHGGLGVDNLGGGTGADSFAFSDFGAANADSITDFASGEDVIELDGSVFAGIGASGFFVANASGTAQDANDRIVFETDTRQVWYDADGNGAGARQLIATLQVGATLAAADVVAAGGEPPSGNVINGTEGDDELGGTEGAETINGLGGDDSLSGASGDDRLAGGDGNDVLDFVPFEGGGNDTLDGGAGNDTYFASANEVLIDAGGIDTVISNRDWTLAAGFENLSLENYEFDDNGLPGLEGIGNELANRMSTYIGDSGLLDGRAGNDTLVGGFRGDDTLIGNAGNDVLTGDDGGDSFVFNVAPGAANADQITDFLSGSDRIVLDGSVHAGIGASGNFAAEASEVRFAANESGMAEDTSDRVILDTTSGEIWYDADGSGPGARQLIATTVGGATPTSTDFWVINGSTGGGGAVIDGTAGNDSLSGTPASETINGLAGNDTIVGGGGGGDDTINGGDGRDSIEFKEAWGSALTVDWAAGTISFTSVERIAGSNFADRISGNFSAQNLTGQGGADTLWGAGGVDTLWGGNGGDFFEFREAGALHADRVSDFVSGSDKVQLDDGSFANIGALGSFSAGDARFWASSAGVAHDASDRVIYDTDSGQVYYDADGSGGGAAQLVAIVVGAPAFAATDLQVI